jgi:ribokinase
MPVSTPEEITTAAKELYSRGVSQVIVTCGASGAILVNGDGAFNFTPPKVVAVDTTAAGDTFTAAVVCALPEERDIFNAIRFANCAASIAVTRHGAQASVPSRQEVDLVFSKT